MTLKARIENGIVYSPYPSEPVPEMSVYQVVKQRLAEHGDRIAFICDDEEITFSELLKMFQRYAAGFQAHGIKKGDKVLVHLNNSLENLIALYGVVFAGGVAVLCHPSLSNEDIIYRIRNSHVTYILTTASEANRISAICDNLDMEGYFAVGTAPGFVSVTEFKKRDETSYQECSIEDVRNERVVHFYTSGTTGRPKAVEHTHYSIVAGFNHRRTTSKNDYPVIAARTSITSAAGFRLYLRAPSSGAKTVMYSASTGIDEMIDLMGKFKVTNMIATVDLMRRIARKIEEKGIRLDDLECILFSGVSVAHQSVKQLHPAFNPAIMKSGYGSTEAGGICQPPMGPSKWYDVGFPFRMAQIKIVDVESGKVLGPNQQGELLVKSPTCMIAYYGNPEATSRAITPDGWIGTGDVCYYNEDGQFFYVDRMEDFFPCMGKLVAPSTIENVLLDHEEVQEAVVIGVPHPQYQKVAMAFVLLKAPKSNITEAELQNFVAGRLDTCMHLHGGVKFVPVIPKDVSGKINRKKLQELHQED